MSGIRAFLDQHRGAATAVTLTVAAVLLIAAGFMAMDLPAAIPLTATPSPSGEPSVAPSRASQSPSATPGPTPTSTRPSFPLMQDPSLDAALARCPTEDEVAFVDAVIPLTFEYDGTAPVLVCTEEGGSANLTHLQERAYQAVLSIWRIPFDAPLPWTDLPLSDWFSHEVKGIIFRATPNSSCCDSPGVLVIKSDQDLSALGSNQWIDASEPAYGMIHLVQLLIHEARHVAGFPHTCPDASGNDATLEEGGAWAAVYWFYTWLAEHAHTTYMTPDDPPDDRYVAWALEFAKQTLIRTRCPPVVGELAVVVADRLNVRVAPDRDAAMATVDLGDAGPVPAFIGRNTPWQDVYLFDGPVASDGFAWYLIGTDAGNSQGPDIVGWVPAGDASQPWLVPASRCPDPPFELADVTYAAATWGMRLACFGGQQLTLQGWYPELPADAETSGDCPVEPAWLFCGYAYTDLRVSKMTYYDARSAERIEFKVDPASGLVLPNRGQWIEIVGQFDHPAAQSCSGEDINGVDGLTLHCRLEFVVTGFRELFIQ